MLPGPDYLLKCTKCGALYVRASLTSGNTMGGKYYTDGYAEFPMLPEYPDIFRCKECGEILRVNETHVGYIDRFSDEGPDEEAEKALNDANMKWNDVPHIRNLAIEDLIAALENNFPNNADEEFELRNQLLYRLNDYNRHSESNNIPDQYEPYYKQNTERIIEMTNKAINNVPKDFQDEDKVEYIARNFCRMAELYREIGNFAFAEKMLHQVLEEDVPENVKDMAKYLLQLVESQNSLVREL